MHLHYLRELSDRFEIAALCDLSRTVVDSVGEAYGVDRRYTDWTALLAAPIVRGTDIDAKTVASLQADDEARVTAAIQVADPVLRYAYRHSLLDSMIHDINLMRSLLGEPKTLRFASVAQEGISLFLDFPQSAAAMHWVNLTDGVARYQHEFAFFYPERRATLVFPSPLLRRHLAEML